MDRKKTAVAVALTVAVAGIVGYAYIAGVGPLEEDPTAGLEEAPETESTYSFGEVPETGSEASGGVDSRVDGGMGTQSDSGTDAAETEVDAGTDGQADTEASVEVSAADEDADSQADEEEDETEDETDEADDGDEEGEEDSSGDSQDGDADDGDDDVNGGGDSEDDSSAVDTLDTEPERSGPPFVPELENMEECGETCREATVALQNNMNVNAENVVVYVRLHAGDSTDPDDVVWGENRNIGTLAPGEVYRETETVDLTPQQANKVREEDGIVTAKATVESDQATATFVERDNVG